MLANTCHADPLTLPPPPINSSSIGDEIRSRDGTLCKGHNSGPVLDLGVSAAEYTNTPNPYNQPFFYQNVPSAVGYARIIIPLGNNSRKVDCNRLYELELERLQLELEQLRANKENKIIIK